MVKSLDEVIERLQYKADNIKAKLEPSYFTECIDYLKSIIPCYLGSPCEYQTEDVNYNHGWIPCSERLPEENEIVMCSVKKEYASYRIVLQRFTNEEYWHNGIVEAWQPLPEPYKAEKMKGE